jgi:nitroreductase
MHKTLLQALNKRYAVKQFDSTKNISQVDLDTLIESLRLTPTAYGLQLMKVVVVEDKNLRQKLLDHSYNQQQVVDASHLIVLCRESSFEEFHVTDYITNMCKTRNLSSDDLVGFKKMLFNFQNSVSKENHTNWMTNQIYIALGNLLTSCAILEINACPMEGFIAEKYDSILNLDKENLNSVLVIPVGYAVQNDKNKVMKKVRRPKNDFLIVK